MKTTHTFIFKTAVLALFFISSAYAYSEDIPEGYYAKADGKKDSLLKSALHDTICKGIRYVYGTNQYHSSTKAGEWEKGDLKAYGTWEAFPLTDITEGGSVWDMYSCSVRYYPAKRGESACSMNIEHCLPKSWWGGTVNDAYKDLFNLNPSDQRANSQKSNFPPGHVQKGDKFDNGSFRMDTKKSSRYGYVCYEPEEEYRGDFARTYFYMATAYEDIDWSDTYKDYVNSGSYLFFSDNIISVLLDWHRADPVSDKEICRADRISSIQHNRNPFIDYPELVEYIWGDKKGENVDFSVLTCTAGSADCPLPQTSEPSSTEYDTIIALPMVTKSLVTAVEGGYASDKIQSNGTAAVTMGTSGTDGSVGFGGLSTESNTFLYFRASVYNTAERMQIDVIADGEIIESVRDTVRQETRNEVWYKVSIPEGTKTVELLSVGGSTSVRACLQALYLLHEKEQQSAIKETFVSGAAISKYIKDGKMVILIDGNEHDIYGHRIH